MHKRISERNRNHAGELMAICGYRSANDIDIIWQSDNSVQKTTYQAFRDGRVLKNNTKHAPSEWVGISFADANGIEAEIIECKSETDVTVRYPDGNIVAGLNLEDVANGNFDRGDAISVDEFVLFAQEFKQARGIEQEREDTYQNVRYMLERFRRCLMIRPCSFGKTYIGLRLFKSPRYQKCLFLHPQKDELNASKVLNSHINKIIDTKTYTWLRSLKDAQIEKLDYDIIFMDEVHSVGGDRGGKGAVKTFEAVMKLMASHPETHFVGATATPVRMDGINVAHEVFLDHLCYPYTDSEAFEDGLLKRPYYRYCVYDVVKKIRSELNNRKENIKIDREELIKTLKLTPKELEEIDSQYMHRHIKESCDKVLPDTSYMRFIVFYLTNKEIEENKEKVETWFKKAYPDHEISSIVVTSRSNHDLKDVDGLPTEPSDPQKYKGRIDLVFNCEMLCMGYHSELITGLVMDRKTQSLAKYQQMIGRLLSCDNDNPVIIFDVVDNIHADFITGHESLPVDHVAPAPIKTKVYIYDEVIKWNPAAKNWVAIQDNNAKAEKAEKLAEVYTHQFTDSQPVQTKVEKTASRLVFNGKEIFDPEEFIKRTTIAPAEEKSLKKELTKAFSEIKEEKPSWQEAIKKLAGIENEFGTLTPEKDTDSTAHTSNEETAPVSEPKAVEDNDATQTEPVSASDVTNSEYVKTTEEESLGYLKGHYHYDYETKTLYARNAQLLCQSIDDYADRISELNRRMVIADMEYVIEKWHALDKICEEDYKNYDEVDVKSPKYKLLKSCAKVYGNGPVEPVLRYMIEKIA